MDYEKAYKAVLKTATQWIKDGCTDKERICLESVFPELAESEDERNRKWILEYLYDGLQKADEQFKDHFKSAIDWLEKQKEPHYTKRNALFDKCVANCDPEIIKKVSDEIDSQLKKEQKLAEPSDEELQRHQDELHDFKMFAARQAKEYHISFVHDFEWNNFCVELLSYFNEQKPAEWSKEDKNRLEEAIEVVEANGCWVRSDDAVKQVSDFLKSLPERFNLQPKQEWSEEDEDKLYQIIEILLADKEIARRDNPQHHDVLCKAYDELISWLKSLRPHWKPSEEQMQYLLAVINDPNNAGAESCHLILESLYNNLKKLI